jgi:hypothetical protein
MKKKKKTIKTKPKIRKKPAKVKPIENTSSLPNNVDETEFVRVVENISKRLGYKFKFGYHDFDDMKQQAYIFALEGLQKYDNKRPLENFLWTHIRNRLFNYKRNNYQRPDKPCLTCPLYDKSYSCSTNQCSKYTNKSDCELYSNWSIRNEAKKNIMQPTYIDKEPESYRSSNLVDSIGDKEILQFLDLNVSSEYRENYLKLKHGLKIPKQQLLKLKQYIQNLIVENNLCLKKEDN